MSLEFLRAYAYVAVLLLLPAVLVLVAQFSWRWTLVALAVQFLAAAWLVSLNWPLTLALVKLVVGWMAGAVLATAQAGTIEPAEPLSGRLFRVVAASLLLVALYTVFTPVQEWLRVDPAILAGALILIGAGLVQVSMTAQPLRVGIGLLTFLTGFEVLYAALELSVLVAGLLAVVNLGLALAVAYLLPGEPREAA